MRCPYCGFNDNRVIESRSADNGQRIRRRRECTECMRRFTTYEVVEDLPIVVVKRNGFREVYNRNKLFEGILKSCGKRPISINDIEDAVDKIEYKLRNSLDREVSSEYIGECAMEVLKDIDEVAYIRFASVYRQFKDVSTFMEELKKLMG